MSDIHKKELSKPLIHDASVPRRGETELQAILARQKETLLRWWCSLDFPANEI